MVTFKSHSSASTSEQTNMVTFKSHSSASTSAGGSYVVGSDSTTFAKVFGSVPCMCH